MQTVKLKVYPYMTTGGDPVEVEAPCRIVGDLAIHPSYHAWQGEASQGKAWCATHIATGLSAGRAMAHLTNRDAGQREVVAWAKAWQEACPAFFAAWRDGDTAQAAALAPDAMRIGQTL